MSLTKHQIKIRNEGWIAAMEKLIEEMKIDYPMLEDIWYSENCPICGVKY
jgi:hypothetical protein